MTADRISVTPEPTDEEMTAILTAYDVLWPAPDTAVTPEGSPRWRFAGRWWSPRPRYGGWT